MISARQASKQTASSRESPDRMQRIATRAAIPSRTKGRASAIATSASRASTSACASSCSLCL